MRLLLTGATGFLGRNLLLEALRRQEYQQIYVPVRSQKKIEMQLAGDGFDRIPGALKIFEGDHRDWRLPAEAMDAEHVVHSAGVIFARTWPEYQQVNVEGTVRLLNALKSPTRIVVLSSLAAGGPCEGQDAKREGDRDEPVTWYGRSKLEMERRLAQQFGHLPFVCLRPPMIFGARDAATLPLFKMVRKRICFKPGFQPKVYSVLSVKDLVGAVFAVLKSNAPLRERRYYYVTDPRTITDRQLIRSAAVLSGHRGVVVPIPQTVLKAVSRVVDSIPTWRTTIPTLSVDRAKEIWPNRWVADSGAFQKDFGWGATQSFQESLADTRNWYIHTGQLNA